VDAAIPQVGCSLASRSTSPRTSAARAGRPRRCGQVQRRRTRSRCQPSSVAGCTSIPRQAGRGSSRASPASTAGRPSRALAGPTGGAAPRPGGATPAVQAPQHLAEQQIQQSQAMRRSSWPRGAPGELAAQHPRPTLAPTGSAAGSAAVCCARWARRRRHAETLRAGPRAAALGLPRCPAIKSPPTSPASRRPGPRRRPDRASAPSTPSDLGRRAARHARRVKPQG
jgi:hypothetical protein